MVERAEKLVSVMCFLHRTFAINSSFFPVSLHIAAPNPQAGFLSILQLQSPLRPLVLSSMQFYSVSSPPPLIYCILLPTSRTSFAWLTNPRPSSAERFRPSLITRKEIYGMITTHLYRCYPVFLYIMRHHWQITVCLLGSQPLSLQTQKITPSSSWLCLTGVPFQQTLGQIFCYLCYQQMSIIWPSEVFWSRKKNVENVFALSKDKFETSGKAAYFLFGLNLSDPGSFLPFILWTFMLLIPSRLLNLSLSFHHFSLPFSPKITVFQFSCLKPDTVPSQP